MRVLIVHSKTKNITTTFIKEQVDSLVDLGLTVEIYTIDKPGISGYLAYLKGYFKKIKEFNPDVIHAHYGLSGLFANFQRKVPVVTTYHGSDIYNDKSRKVSGMAYRLSKGNIFVSKKLMDKFGVEKGEIITSGVNLNVFNPNESKQKSKKKDYVLFSAAFDKKVKNYPLAKAAIDIYNKSNKSNTNLKLKELKNMSREEVADAMCKAQALLITSHYEGSSQVLKEAMACNCPVISVDVGSACELIKPDSESGKIVSYDAEEIAEVIIDVITNKRYSKGRDEILQSNISLAQVARRLENLYRSAINNY